MANDREEKQNSTGHSVYLNIYGDDLRSRVVGLVRAEYLKVSAEAMREAARYVQACTRDAYFGVIS